MLSFISVNEEEKWDSVVKSFKEYDVYYFLDYTKAFQIHGDGEPLLIYFEENDFKAMNVVMKRDISLDKKFRNKIPENTFYDISTPYGYGGFLLEGNYTSEKLKRFEKIYVEACKSKGIISEFVRFHPVLNNVEQMENIYDTELLGKTITMKLQDKNQVWKSVTSKNRNVIRKAVKSGVEIYWGRDRKLFEIFIDMYNNTMDKDNATDYYYFDQEFYNSILTELRFNTLIFYSVYEGKIIAMSIIMFANGKMHYHLSASNRDYQRFAPTNLLLYEAASWGSENGFETFHLGGGLGGKEDNLYKFKKSFNKDSNTNFAVGRKIFNSSQYAKLISIREEDESFDGNSNYFPLYRA